MYRKCCCRQQATSNKFGLHELLPRTAQNIMAIRKLCDPSPTQEFCLDLIGIVYGENRENLDRVSSQFFYYSNSDYDLANFSKLQTNFSASIWHKSKLPSSRIVSQNCSPPGADLHSWFVLTFTSTT